MKAKIRRSNPISIQTKRWAAYATAGTATALAGSQSAEAAIHYSGHLGAPWHQRDCDVSAPAQLRTFQLDQPGDSFRLGRHLNDYCRGFDFGTIFGLASAAFRGPVEQSHAAYVSKLSFGQRISSGPFTSVGGAGVLFDGAYNFYHRGYWTTTGTGFIGFRFNNGAGVQYGWARIKLGGIQPGSLGPRYGYFELFDYAYADVGEPIRAGQISSDEQSIDQGSLGWLAMGAIGLFAWRKSRSRTASQTKLSLPG